jgi:hypothetical protein
MRMYPGKNWKNSSNWARRSHRCSTALQRGFRFRFNWTSSRHSVSVFIFNTQLFSDPIQNALGHFIFAEQR